MNSEELPQAPHVSDYPVYSEKEWYALAMSFGVITTVTAGFLLWWVFYGDFPDEFRDRASVAGTIVAFGGAITTFCTVAWRGLITTRQADTANQQMQEAIEQGKRFERQLQATEINNVAVLFEKAASLLSDASKSKQRAAIALLRNVGLSRTAGLGREVVDLLTDYLSEEAGERESDVTAAIALKYADEIAQSIGMVTRCNVTLSDLQLDTLPNAIAGVTYKECDITNVALKTFAYYENCLIRGCTVNLHSVFHGTNRFYECNIIAVIVDDDAEFHDCDFSDCKVATRVTPRMMTDCYYFDDRPPIERILPQLKDGLRSRPPEA
ncbi:hypothetical protein QLQ09_19730 [Brucella sp. NM4]|uniref:hypothetical protein n=1 Tax=Brucella sp. NM4 TaxID=3045175 RepID=UPI0024BD02EE|nr:hypothetical protein [Brucella sp. NM4]WHS33592.1 hypothetical protein QLQ09_19730 [Brucella sp. NM4]